MNESGITSAEYDRVTKRASDITDILGRALGLRDSQKATLYRTLATAGMSYDLREHLADYIDAAKGWERP